MKFKVVVAGCRSFTNYDIAEDFINDCINEIGNVFLSGCCRGTDMLGEQYADSYGFKVERHPPLWEKYGKSAGLKRNEEMAKISDIVICFWDRESKGTQSMIDYAKTLNKILYIKYIN